MLDRQRGRPLRPTHVAPTILDAARRLLERTSDLVGIGVVDIEEFSQRVSAGGRFFVDRLFTAAEWELCGGRHERLASRLAGKQAVAMMLGLADVDVHAREIELRAGDHGAPYVTLRGAPCDVAGQAGLHRLLVSISREGGCASAIAVGVRTPGPAAG